MLLKGPTQKRSRPAASKATQAASADPASHAVAAYDPEKRAPAMSGSCLCHLLTAIAEDGLIAETEDQVSIP